jgi:hypothetical protein
MGAHAPSRLTPSRNPRSGVRLDSRSGGGESKQGAGDRRWNPIFSPSFNSNPFFFGAGSQKNGRSKKIDRKEFLK